MKGKILICSLTIIFSLGASSLSSSASTGIPLAKGNSSDILSRIPTKIKPGEINKHSDGGQNYTYYVNGSKVTYFVPPVGFNPLKASDEKLAEYGFEPKPKDKENLTIWEKEMSSYKSTEIPDVSASIVESNTSNPINSINSINSINAINATNNTEDSSNWAGYINYYKNSSGSYVKNWCGVQGDFVQPTNKSTANGSGSGNAESSWIGLDRYLSRYLS